ncbi:MAG: hypothetical protein NTV02_02625 [Candidatus Zambryskibacteria bacterium]|nr:hypothetical protein [Candidatus Zambryskibacteria bacterium]
MKKYSKIILFVSVFFFSFASSVSAADIFLGTDKNQVNVNDTVSTVVYVNTLGSAINSAEGIIGFSKDILSVESVSLGGSVFSIWVEQPSFSNAIGTVSFNGGSPNPGFNGARGAVIRITFRAKKAGTANLTFNSASVYANDGLGTDITSARRSASVEVVEGSTAPVPSPVPQSTTNATPSAPVIVSGDMPDAEKWYSKNGSVFSWNVPGQVITNQLLLGTFPNSVPTVSYTPPIGNKEIAGLADGISYLHVRFANANGWGAIAHRKIKIDTVAPTDLAVSSSVTPDEYIKLSLSSRDKTSGVQSYKVLLDGNLLAETSLEASLNSSASLVVPAIPPGYRELSVRAYDRAGNSTEALVSVESPQIEVPRIVKYSETIVKGDRIGLSGTTYPTGDVLVFVQNEGEESKKYQVKADESGNFAFKSDGVSRLGLSSLWVVASRGENVVSEASARVYVRVNKSLVVRGALYAIEALSVIIPLILLVLVLIFTTYYGFHKFRMMRRKLRADLDTTEEESHKIFEVIKEDVKNSIQLFKKLSTRRKISDEEKDILETLSKDVEQAEKYFEKRIEKIEREDL